MGNVRLSRALSWALVALIAGCGGGNVSGGGAAVPSSTAPDGPQASPPGMVKEIATGDYHSCARMGDGKVRCWGRNAEGQLGDGTTEARTKPVEVAGVSGAVAIGLGAHASCAVLADRTVTCWGSGNAWNDGQTRTNAPPTKVQGVSDVVDMDAGGALLCAWLAGGGVKCWGDANVEGTPPSSNVAEVSVEEAHACARTKDGSVHCWGDSTWTKTFGDPGVTGATDLGTGDSFACVVTGGQLACWGRDEEGELGTGKPDFDDHPKATTVPGLSGVKAVEAGEAHGCAVLESGAVTCWGSNADGELGRGQATNDPQPPGEVTGLSGIAAVALGNDHACALSASGVVTCWGSNKMGQLGDGTQESHASPAPVAF